MKAKGFYVLLKVKRVYLKLK